MTLRVRMAALLAAALATHALLVSGALGGLPVFVRLLLAFGALVLLPGHGWLAAIGELPPGGALLAPAWALGLGIGWLALQVLVTRMLHVPFTVLAAWSAPAGALPWLVAMRAAPAVRPRDDGAPVLRGAAAAAVVLAALAAFVLVARVPPPTGTYTDSPDHIGTIRRMMASGDAFPKDAFFRDAGDAGADPRKGLWHPCVALLATVAHADPLAAWEGLAAILAALFVLGAAAFGTLAGGSAGAAVAAWALPLTYGRTLATPYFREAVFATKLADQLALAVLTAVLADLGARRGRSRAVAMGLAAGAIATHVFASIHLGVVLGAFGVALLVRDRRFGPDARRLAVTSFALALPCLPYLLWRAHGAYAPRNIIHTEPQGLLLLAHGARVVDPGVLGDWFGRLWIVFPLSCVAWARAARRPAALLLLAATCAVAVLLFVPPVTGVLQPRLGYLLMRFVWLLPMSGALAFAVPALARRAGGGRAAGRLLAALALAGLAVLLAPAVRDAFHAFTHAAAMREYRASENPRRWREALAWMDANLPAGSVVLTDPATAYSVPMMTRHYVTCLVDQHSSPNDSLALARILDARDALDPYAPWQRTREVVRRWGATVIALNDRFGMVPELDYWAPSPAWYARARARLESAPSAFHLVHDTGDFAIWRIDRAALDALAGGGGPRPYVRAWTGGAAAGDAPVPVGLALSGSQARPGDSLVAAIDWHVPRPQPPGYWFVSVRFEHALPAGFAPPAWCAKPARKVLERLRRERYRFRDDHPPVHGNYGVDLWRPADVVRDSFAFRVPADAAPGEWRIEAALIRQPHYPNLHLADYLRERDYYSGVAIGRLRVLPKEGRP